VGTTVGEGDGDDTGLARVEAVSGEAAAGAGLFPAQPEVAVFLEADVFDVERPADAEVAHPLVAAVIGARRSRLSEERREAKQKNENRSRHAPRIGRDHDRWQAKALTKLEINSGSRNRRICGTDPFTFTFKAS
jgi:hypothetical protein